MKRILLGLFIVSSLGTASVSVTTAYICNGKYSTKYHLKKNCRGLSNCSTNVATTTVASAKEKGRTLCGHED